MLPKAALPSQQRIARLCVLSTLALAASFCANIYYGPRLATVGDPYPTVFTRTPQYIVAFWGALYLLQLGYLNALWSNNIKVIGPASGAIGYTFILAHVLKGFWTLAWLKKEFVISETVILLNLLNLFSAYTSLHRKDPTPSTRSWIQNHLPVRFFLSITMMDVLHNGAIAFPQLLRGDRVLPTTWVAGLAALALSSLYHDSVLRFVIALHFAVLGVEQKHLSLVQYQDISCFIIAGLSAALGVKALFTTKASKSKNK
ncbi:hypothetical protein NEOLI_001307 [Neolecta irregularis DAH-3]|uniref:Uncharacterized protein n=1 Tax=Neolecta irregularis (strain DAH-3) TaxID=1198029 RepID=A0A1U7LKM0_NEOID|nr:hypothetical protein NEOLI_001307 [Neolecta irregularis DAH-3]|eukprot:OLL23197.1 hypothetical protein NEOLI_001307 [Neolecta irregularis DAH-3]